MEIRPNKAGHRTGSEASHPAPQQGVLATQDITTAFAMFDADDSGFIDKDEFETLFETLRASRPGSTVSAGRTGFNAGPA